jgi:hypothetical protein
MNDATLPTVRYAVPEDYPHIIAIAEQLHAENGTGKIHYPTATAAIMRAINRDASLIGLIGPVGDIRGIVFLRLAQMWHHGPEDAFLEEIFLYVPPEHRKGTHNAATLIRFAKGAANRLGVPLFIGVLSNHKTKAKLRLYEKHLGEPVGVYFYLMPKAA